MRKSRAGYLLAALLIGIGVALAAVSPYNTNGEHIFTLTSSTHSVDTGVALAKANSSDSSVEFGLLFINASADTKLADTTYASRPIIGNLNNALYVRSSDTATSTVSTTFADSETSTGSWSSELTGKTGSVSSTFLSNDEKSTDVIGFADTALFPLTSALADGADTIMFPAGTETFLQVARLAANDVNRVTIIGPTGKVTGDTNFPATGLVNIRLETGATRIVAIVRDASQGKFKIFTGKVFAGGQGARNLRVTDSAAATNLGRITMCTVTITESMARRVGAIAIVDLPNDAGAGMADAYSRIDSGTPGFETRVASSVFEILLLDTAGQRITSLDKSLTIALQYQFAANADSTKYSLLHMVNGHHWVNSGGTITATNVITGASADFSAFAIGQISSSTLKDDDDNKCVVDRTFGNTVLSGVMPAMRSCRDILLGSSFGRLAVETYYGFAALLIVAAAGFGLARMRG